MPFMKNSKCKHTCNHSCYNSELGWICELYGDCDMCSCCSSFEPKDEKLSFPNEPVVINERKVKRQLKSRLKKAKKHMFIIRTRMTEPELHGFTNIDNKQTNTETEVLDKVENLKRYKCFYPFTETDLNAISKALIDNETLKTTYQSQLKTIDLFIDANRRLLKYRQAIEAIKENLIVSYDEGENYRPCLMISIEMLGIKISKPDVVVIYKTFDKEKIALLKEVLNNEKNN